ncbi:unnamed protein product [Urochloa humidicola]
MKTILSASTKQLDPDCILGMNPRSDARTEERRRPGAARKQGRRPQGRNSVSDWRKTPVQVGPVRPPVSGGEAGAEEEGIVAAGDGAEAVEVLELQPEEDLLDNVVAEKIHRHDDQICSGEN